MSERIWFCKIGGPVDRLPDGSDWPMRRAIQRAFEEVTGSEHAFTFSGWGGSLTEGERAVVENRRPASPPAPAIDHYARLAAIINDDGSLSTHGDIEYIARDAMHALATQNTLIEENERLRKAAPAIDVEAVAKERDELRQRCDDLALIADTWASSDEDGNPWGLRIADHKLILTGGEEDDIVLDRDERTGLPILNDAARSALRIRAALGGKEQR